MSEDLQSVAYVSRNRLTGDPARELERLVRKASLRNAQNGLTGALVCSPQYFAQVIEGPEAALEDVFERIQMDPRHSDIEVLYLTTVARRQFEGWGMASAGVLDEDSPIEAVVAALGGEAGVAHTDAAGREALGALVRLLRDRELS